MKREISIHLIYLVTAILLTGMLIAPLKKAAATNAYYQLADGITINPTSGLITTEAGGTATFTVVLTSQPGSAVTIGLSSSDPTEGTVSPVSVTLNHGNWYVEQTVTVTGLDDPDPDGDIDYQIITAPAVSNDQNYNGLDAADISVTNQDNDTIGISVNPVSGLITTEAGGTVTFTVGLNNQPSADVTIGLSSSDLTEGTVSPASLTFDPISWSVGQTVTVTGVDDLEQDGNIVYQVITAPAISTDLVFNGLDAADVTVTNQDDDSAGITVNPVSGLVTSEAGGSATFTMVLNSRPITDVIIGLSSSDTTEANISPIQVTFTSLNWDTSQVATVTGVDDQLDDGDQAYTIITGLASSGDPVYDGWDGPDVAGININNDFTPVAMQDIYLTGAAPDQPLIVDPPGVLSNDTDANNDSLIALKMSDPQKGVLDFDINGSFIYTPTQNFTQVETDSFSYVANDGTLESDWTTVEIMIDPIFPTINWISPVTDGEIYEVNNQVVRLQADAADNLSIEQVDFFRWDALLEDYVDIGVVHNSPYQWDLDPQTLNNGWNQIFARAKDTAGNNSTIPFIWIYREFSTEIFLPFIAG
jgi:hypothetical protein